MDGPPQVSAAAVAAARSEIAADLRLHAHQVGNAFVQDYYAKLRHSPEQVRGFYHEGSRLTRPNAAGGADTVTTLEDINRKIMATTGSSSSWSSAATTAPTTVVQGSIRPSSSAHAGREDATLCSTTRCPTSSVTMHQHSDGSN